jgi:hypothetical protein
MMDALEERLAIHYPYSQLGLENEFGTTAVFSRYPFTDVYILDLESDRPPVVIKTKILNQEITFVSVHLLWTVVGRAKRHPCGCGGTNR